MRAFLSALACWLAHVSAFAGGLVPDSGAPLAPMAAAPQVALVQRLDARLPLDAAFVDSNGRAIRLADEFGSASRQPVILALGYYRCPELCGLLMQGLVEAAQGTGLPPRSYRIVLASIDPSETPADARARRRVELDYARFLGSEPPAMDLLVGPPASIASLSRAIGYLYQPTSAGVAQAASSARFAHPAGIVVATPDGRISRYLMGVRFDAAELRSALVEASGGGVGTLTDRLALLCAHLDPRLGAHSLAVIDGVRAVGLATLALLAVLLRRRRARRGAQGHEEPG